MKELRSKLYAPWKQKQWNTPKVAHDNPSEVQSQASVMLGFADEQAMQAFFKSDFALLFMLMKYHETIAFVKNGKIISQ